MSFPSGHSSLAFAAMVFLSFYMAGHFAIFAHGNVDQSCNVRYESHSTHRLGKKIVRRFIMYFSNHSSKPFWKLLLCLAPWFLATFIAVSRVMDYHHHFEDIVAGSLVGIVCAVLCYIFKLSAILNSRRELTGRRSQLTFNITALSCTHVITFIKQLSITTFQ